MVRLQILCVALPFLVGHAEALKGARVRKLDDVITVSSALPKAKDAAKDCKEKVAPLKGEPGNPTALSANEEAGEVPFCETKVVIAKQPKEKCDEIKAGKLPKGKKVAGGVGVQFRYDKSAQTPELFRKSAEKVAKKAGEIAAGCGDVAPVAPMFGGRKLQDADDALAIAAVDFKKFEWGDECTRGATDCDALNADVSVYYEGERDATEDEAQDMMTLLVETVASQDYGDAEVDIYWLDVGESLEIIQDTTTRRGKTTTTVASVAGATVGLSALAAGAFFATKWYRGRGGASRDGGNVAIANFYR